MKEAKLTANDQRILEEIRIIATRGEKLTCAQIARKLQIAPSSIIKLAQKLEFSGWNDMFYSLSQQYSGEMPLRIDSMDFLEEGMVLEKVHHLAEQLRENAHRPIILACVGDSEFLTDYLLDMLTQRNYRACRYNNALLPRLRDGQLEPGLALFVNESGIVLYDICGRLQEAGCRVLAITSSGDTPLAGIADHTVEIRNRKSPVEDYLPNFFAARVLIFLELLFAEMDEHEK